MTGLAERWIRVTTIGCTGSRGGSPRCLAANLAVAEPALIGRVIAAWPSFALTVSYELLMRQVRRTAWGYFAVVR